MSEPGLSVIVTVVEGGAVLDRCLDALAAQSASVALEILVPFDASIKTVEAQVRARTGVRAISMGTVELPADHEGARHELYDRRRAVGLAHARAPVVALIEDRCVPRPDWSHRVVAAHGQDGVGAVGGAVEPRVSGLQGWALYFCDYGRYQLPFEKGSRPYVSDVNVSYSRPVLESVRNEWKDRYQETVVHWAVQRDGRALILDPEVVVEHGRMESGYVAALVERFHWGRVFGTTRARTSSWGPRIVRSVAAPVLPLILWTRLLLQRLQRGGRTLIPFLAASPAILTFLLAWSAGEAAGTLTGNSGR